MPVALGINMHTDYTTNVRITYGSDTTIMTWDGAQAAATIYVDGQATQYQTADARHYLDRAVQLACRFAWGLVYDTAEGAIDDGVDPTVCTIWSDVSYEVVA